MTHTNQDTFGHDHYGFLRLHRAPKRVRLTPKEDWNAQHQYLFCRSFNRYIRSPEGVLAVKAIKTAVRSGEIGRCENVRFYEAHE